MEFELRAYSDEQDKWSKQIGKRLKAGFEGLTPKLQHKYDAWLTHGQVRQLIFDMKNRKAGCEARQDHSCTLKIILRRYFFENPTC